MNFETLLHIAIPNNQFENVDFLSETKHQYLCLYSMLSILDTLKMILQAFLVKIDISSVYIEISKKIQV